MWRSSRRPISRTSCSASIPERPANLWPAAWSSRVGRRPPASKFPADLAGTAAVVHRIVHAERGDPVARVAARRRRSTKGWRSALSVSCACSPIVVFSLVSGVVADAFDRRRLMLGTSIAAAAVAIALAVLTLRGLTVVWPIYALAAVGAAVSALRSAGHARRSCRRSCREASAERDQRSVTIMLQTRLGRRTIARRIVVIAADRRRVCLHRQRDLVRVRDRRAADDARPSPSKSAASEKREDDRRCRRRARGCGSSSDPRSSARRCCSISSRRSLRRRPRCCRSSRRTSCRSDRRATAGSSRRPPWARSITSAVDGAAHGAHRSSRAEC